jgi:tetratricopeptide (TPR) repeat protein
VGLALLAAATGLPALAQSALLQKSALSPAKNMLMPAPEAVTPSARHARSPGRVAQETQEGANASATRKEVVRPPGRSIAVRQTAANAIEPEWLAAHAALARHDPEEARRQLRNLLARQPRHLEALLGLAHLAHAAGETAAARAFYQTALETAPHDAGAQAGLLGLLAEHDPESAESRLRSLLDGQPAIAAAHFALGNLLAAQARWPEAEAAYFEAVSQAPGNADYRFNLAVSLDHLRRPELAAEHYRLALGGAERQSVAFPVGAARARLARLTSGGTSPAAPPATVTAERAP